MACVLKLTWPRPPLYDLVPVNVPPTCAPAHNYTWFTAVAQAKCLAAQATQIADLLVGAEERLAARNDTDQRARAPLPHVRAGRASQPPPPRRRLVFSRRSKPAGWWLWDFFAGGGGDKANRRRNTPKGVLHEIAAETPSLAAIPSADLALEIIRRTLGIELPGRPHGQKSSKRGRDLTKGFSAAAAAATTTAAPLTWDLLDAAFDPVSEEGAGQEAVGLTTRLDRGGMHAHALQVLVRVRALEGRGLETGIRVPADVLTLATAVQGMEAMRTLALAETKER